MPRWFLALALAGCGADSAPVDTFDPEDTGLQDTDIDDTDTGPRDGPCADGGWGAITDPANAVHVRGDGSPLGDGTAGAPFASIDDALEQLSDPEVPHLALGPGSYTANLAWDRNLVLEGCSADETVLRAADGAAPTLSVTLDAGERATIAGLTLQGGHRGLVLDSDGEVEVHSVRITHATRVGVLARGFGDFLLHDLQVLDVEPDEEGYGWGVALVEPGFFHVVDAEIIEANEYGLLADHAIVDLDNIIIDGTDLGVAGNAGRGMHLQDTGGSVTGGQITASHDAGLFALRPLGFVVMGIIIDGTDLGILPTGDGMVFTDGLTAPSPFRDAYLVTVQDAVITNSARMGILLSGQILAVLNGNTMSGNHDEDGDNDPSVAIGAQNAASCQGTDAVQTWSPSNVMPLDQNSAPTERL